MKMWMVVVNILISSGQLTWDSPSAYAVGHWAKNPSP
jgi:hypothetical protein